MTLPTPQSQLILRPIFEASLFAQFFLYHFENLYTVFNMYYLGAPTTTSFNFNVLIFRFFMPWPRIPTMIECLQYVFERVSWPEKIQVYFQVCHTGAWIFWGQSERWLDVNMQFGWTEGWFSRLNIIFRSWLPHIWPWIWAETFIYRC